MTDGKKTRGSRGGAPGRWTEEQVKLLLDTVRSTDVAKEAFEQVANELGKNVGSVAQKYYNLQRGATGRRKGRSAGPRGGGRAGRAAGASAAQGSVIPSERVLRDVTIDELVTLANSVKAEIDRRSQELETARELLKG